MTITATNKSMPPSPIKWSKSIYHQMADYGWFRDKRVQLIEGEIIEMAPMGSKHWVAVNKAYRELSDAFPRDKFTLSMQCPIDLGADSEPESDIAVIDGIPSDYANALPTQDKIALVVEVSDTSLAFDRDQKAKLYAAAGVREYWILDLSGRTVEIRRDPVLVEGRYATTTLHTASELITPPSATSVSIRVSDLIL